MKHLFLIFTVLFISCSNENYFLTNNNYKYWIKISKDKSKSVYYFDSNNRWLVFWKRANGQFERNDAEDMILIEKWFWKESNQIEIGGLNYKILMLSDDSLIISSKYSVDSLIQCPVDLIPKEYQMKII